MDGQMDDTTTADVGTLKDQVRSEWRTAAAGWFRWIPTLEGETAGPAITKVLLEAAAVGPGDIVLDLATGYGEPGLSAVRIVGSRGHVTCGCRKPVRGAR